MSPNYRTITPNDAASPKATLPLSPSTPRIPRRHRACSHDASSVASGPSLATSSGTPLPTTTTTPIAVTTTTTSPPLKTWSLAILIFYTVSGGPFGIEPTIRASGNLYSILGFLLFPLIWSVPEALVTAELGSSFRHASAGVAWVEEAFGESMGFMCGYLSWVSGATDNAIYPILFLEYVGSVLGWDNDTEGGSGSGLTGWERFAYVALISIALAFINYRGLDIVGHASLLVCIIAMSPFVIMVLVGASQVDPHRWLQTPNSNTNSTTTTINDINNNMMDDDFETSPGPLPMLTLGGILWRPYLNNMFWNLNSFDSAASFAAECTDVKHTYPRGIFAGLIMTILLYIIPLMVAVGATDYAQSEWVDGHLGAAAVDIGGTYLGAWTVFAAGISNLGMFEAEMSADAFQIMGMAEQGYLPRILAVRSKYGTPTSGIVVGTIVIIMFGYLDFGQLITLLNTNYALSLMLEYAAFVKLRLYNKELERPYRIPIPDWAAVLLVIPPILGILVIFLISNWYVYIFNTGAIALGLVVLKQRKKSSRWGSVRNSRSNLSSGACEQSSRVPLLDDESNNNKTTIIEDRGNYTRIEDADTSSIVASSASSLEISRDVK